MKFTLKNIDIYLKKLIAFKDIQTVNRSRRRKMFAGGRLS